MKKIILTVAAIGALAAFSVNAQDIEQPKLFDNVYIGVNGGVTTPMNHGAFFGDMRGTAGINIGKQITPVFGAGIEASANVNTSSWRGAIHSSTAFDNSYVGLYGTADLFNLFGGYKCEKRPFTIEALVGAGWGHDYFNQDVDNGVPYNYFVTKAGLNFNFNVSNHVTIAVKPSVSWNMIDEFDNGLVGYNINQASFNIVAGVSYTFGPGFKCIQPYNYAEVNELNDQINALRSDLAASQQDAAGYKSKADALAAQLTACQNRKPEIVKEVTNELNSVRFVFFRIGSDKITADQKPNVEMIADYMKHHPDAKVVIKGYASKDGNYDFNIKLAKNRAESVKNMLVKSYGIKADRISAEGQGIGDMFEEESWNRVSICTLETK